MSVTLSYRNNRFEMKSGYEFKHIPKDAKFRYDGETKTWWTTDALKAARLKNYADDSAKEKLSKILVSLDKSMAIETTKNLVWPENLKPYPFQEAGVEWCLNHLNAMVTDEMGCISGDAIITVNRGGKGFKISLKDAYLRFNGLDSRKRYQWNQEIPTRTISVINGELRLNTIKKIVDSGIKKVVQVTLRSGKTLKLTPDHEVLTVDNTWVAIESLSVGDVVFVNGELTCQRCGSSENIITHKSSLFKGFCKTCMYRYLRKSVKKSGKFLDCDGYIRVSGMYNHPRVGPGGYVYEHILVMEQNLGRFLVGDESIHHKDKNRSNNHIDNLQLTTYSEHGKIHSLYQNFGTFTPKIDFIEKIEDAGDDHVYDIVMDDPGRSFVANGIIVHNCGKTIQAIGVINNTDSKKVLIVTPASLKINWSRELSKWLVKSLSVNVVDSKSQWPNSDIIILNYDILGKFDEEIKSQQWDILILDEVQYLKNPISQRAQNVFGKWKRGEGCVISPIKATRKIALTGTPIENRPKELWGLVHYLKPDVFSSWKYFHSRYADMVQTRWGLDISGASNLEELQVLLRSTLMIRRLKTQVIQDLPSKIRQIVTVPRNGNESILRKEMELWEKFEGEKKKDRDSNLDDFIKSVDVLTGVTYGFTELSLIRHEVALAKVPYAIEFLENISNPCVVFAHHADVIKALADHFGDNCVVLTGSDNPEKRQKAVDLFQSGKVQYFIGSLLASGVGLTLTSASHVVFVESSWVPSKICQGEDRTHRIGQKNSVLVQHLVFDKSLDARMLEVVVEKQKIIDRAMDDNLEEHFFTKKDTETQKENPINKVKVEKISNLLEITPEQVELIHSGLKRLSGVCDGANKEDGVGFNKFDTDFGHKLAQMESLSQKAAVVGRKMLKKYHRQLGKEFIEKLG